MGRTADRSMGEGIHMNSREKIIVVALGKLYQENKELIEDNFTVVALADNNPLKLLNRNDGFKYITVADVKYEAFDKILICTDAQYVALKLQLINEGIEAHKIWGLRLLEQIKWEKDYQKYTADREKYQRLHQKLHLEKFEIRDNEQCMMLSDYRKNAGNVDCHYFYQDILTASKIIARHPNNHIDVGSRIEGFVSHLLAAGIKTTVIDVRPLSIWEIGFGIPSLNFIQADASDLTGIQDNSVESLSSLHAVEHFGLGRYGDEIDPLACFDAMHSLERVLAYEGILYFSVPIGTEEKLMFNGHRIFSPATIIQTMSSLQLMEMYIIHGRTVSRYSAEDALREQYACHLGGYDCGIFIFTKSRTTK